MVVTKTSNIGFLTVGTTFKKTKFKSQCIGLILIVILPFMEQKKFNEYEITQTTFINLQNLITNLLRLV